MSKLSDSQLILLSRAVKREDGTLEDAGSMNPAAAAKVVAALLRKKLMREIRSKPGTPVWRQDEDGRSWSLVITKAGRKAIGVEEEAPATLNGSLVAELPDGRGEDAGANASQGSASRSASENHQAAPEAKGSDATGPGNPKASAGEFAEADTRKLLQLRPGSKLAAIVDLMRQADGASISAMMEATGWLPHTTRAALTGLRKRGFAIAKEHREGIGTIYRIVEPDSTHPGSSASAAAPELKAAA